jgi:LuxR family maltose regulon positive regulatory protein
MMNFASQELNGCDESSSYFEFTSSTLGKKPEIKADSIKLFADKLRVPFTESPIARPRLIGHLEKSLSQFSATLVTGRAGTGKTVLAAQLACQTDYCVAWYKVETADSDWEVFSKYLLGSINQNCNDKNLSDTGETQISLMTESLAAQFTDAAREKPLLIVLDDLHSIFDADWFTEFFSNFVASLGQNVKLILIARTLPPLPLWRLRSKQVLGVMDEKLLAFTLEETTQLFRQHKLSPVVARAAHKRAYGKISKLVEIIEKKAVEPAGTFIKRS